MTTVARKYADGTLDQWQLQVEARRAREEGRSWPPSPGKTVYAMVPTGRNRIAGTASAPVADYVQNVLQPIMVTVAQAMSTSMHRMTPAMRNRIVDDVDSFGTEMDSMVTLLHQGKTDEAINVGSHAVDRVLKTTQELGMTDASNALRSLKSHFRDQVQVGSTS